METPGEITVLLHRWNEGDKDALDRLMPLVYPRLKAIAMGLERHQNPGADLHATALVNETFLRPVKQQGLDWERP